MIAQRIRHSDEIRIDDGHGNAVRHTPELVSELFDEELNRIIRELPSGAEESAVEKYVRARKISEQMIARGEFDPV